MSIFVTGINTDTGKTVVSVWLCCHTQWNYFKPVRMGNDVPSDGGKAELIAGVKAYKPIFEDNAMISPHVIAEKMGVVLDANTFKLPSSNENLIVEGAGGVGMPLCYKTKHTMLDLIKHFDLPTIVVAHTGLGAVGHSLLTIDALRRKGVKLAGFIISEAEYHLDYTAESIRRLGEVEILAEIPRLQKIDRKTLMSIPLTDQLKKLLY